MRRKIDVLEAAAAARDVDGGDAADTGDGESGARVTAPAPPHAEDDDDGDDDDEEEEEEGEGEGEGEETDGDEIGLDEPLPELDDDDAAEDCA